MKKSKGIVLLSAVFLGAVAFLSREKILLAVGEYLVVEDELVPVDVIHVIAGEDYRTEYAIQLYLQGYARYIFFTGGWCSFHNYYHGDHGRQLALLRGVPPEAIAFDDSSVTSTYAEAVLLKAWIDQRSTPIRSVMVVSDPFHMRRARWTYRQVMKEGSKILMAPVPFEQTNYKRHWWADETSQQFVKEEYIKSGYYILRYKLTWGKLREWLARFDIY